MIEVKNFRYNENIFSEKAFKMHINLYHGYAKKINEIISKLETTNKKESNKNYSEYRSLKKELSHNMNAVIFHELFFRNIEKSESKPSEKYINLVKKHFEDYQKWQDDFIATAKASRGWVICGYEQKTHTIQNIMIDNHDTGLVLSIYPILILDMWEHSYILDYEIDIDTYINAFMNAINWNVIEKRIKNLEV